MVSEEKNIAIKLNLLLVTKTLLLMFKHILMIKQKITLLLESFLQLKIIFNNGSFIPFLTHPNQNQTSNTF